MTQTLLLSVMVVLSLLGCTAPGYLTVPPAAPVGQDRRLTPGLLEQSVVRSQHLGQLHAEVRYLEDVLLRAEQKRLNACRSPEATQVDSMAYQRCQLKDQLYEQLKADAAAARDRYLRAMSGRGGVSQ
jgi:uncharacterized protein YdcH (DUF465 family)